MKVLVTGGAGFIGSHVVEQLINEGIDVRIIDNLSTGKKINLPHGIKLYKLDIQHKNIDKNFCPGKILVGFATGRQ